MPSSTSNSEFQRVIPALPWRGIAVAVIVGVLVATAVWEVYCRSLGYEPTLNDTEDFWAHARRQLQPESVAIIGDSRAWLYMDLDELERGLGRRPVQLALAGSCAYPVLEDLANDQHFHGTVICSIVPGMFFAPGGHLIETSEKAVRRYHGQTWAQRVSYHLCPARAELCFSETGRPHARCIAQEIADREPPECPRASARAALLLLHRPRTPRPHDRAMRAARPPPDPRARRLARALHPSATSEFRAARSFRRENESRRRSPLRQHKKRDRQTSRPRRQSRFRAVPDQRSTEGIRRPRHPAQKNLGPAPPANCRARIYFEDFPELASFTCPEWSHLSAGDSVEFTKRLVPHLRDALQLNRDASK